MAGMANHFCSLEPNLHLKLYLPIIISVVKHHHCSSTDFMGYKENLAVTHSLNMSQNFGLCAALKMTQSFGIHFIWNITSQITIYVVNTLSTQRSIYTPQPLTPAVLTGVLYFPIFINLFKKNYWKYWLQVCTIRHPHANSFSDCIKFIRGV
jgi:hypothetical protein